MSQIYSTQEMVTQLEMLVHHGDLTAWEEGFTKTLIKYVREDTPLSERQFDALAGIFNKHFG